MDDPKEPFRLTPDEAIALIQEGAEFKEGDVVVVPGQGYMRPDEIIRRSVAATRREQELGPHY